MTQKSSQPIIMIKGGKGGVGKSTVCMATLDNLGPSAVLIETDTTNPDVAKAYWKTNTTRALNLDERAGWIDLVDLAAETKEALVINGAARSVEAPENAAILREAMKELDRNLIVLFVMSRTRDSLELLADHRDLFPADVAQTWAVLNSYFGTPDMFTRYMDSNQRKEIEAQTGTLVFPDLADRVLDQLNHERLTIAEAAVHMTIGNRMELQRWQREAHNELRKAIG